MANRISNNNNNRKKYIYIKGARLHNLKNINVEIPRNAITVITGVSGSGKSSLAFETIYAEGQRRFVESLSAYARQFLERMDKPDVDSIDGLPPAIAIEQKPPQRNPRSTVGTSTEIYDYLRLLFGRIGTTICRKCGNPVRKDSASSIVNELKLWSEGTKIYIMFKPSPGIRKVSAELDKYKGLGFYRIVLNNSDEIINLNESSLPDSVSPDDLFILTDRTIVNHSQESITRLTESIESAINYGDGKIVIRNLNEGKNYKFSGIFECAQCEIQYVEPEPKLFLFNNPFGACPNCQGFGRTMGIDEELVIPDKTKPVSQAIHPFRTPGFSQYQRALLRIAYKYDINPDELICSLTEEQMKIIWEGADEYPGINGFFAQLEEQSYKLNYRVMISRYRGYTRCKACDGSRLRTSARQVFVGGKNLPQLIKLPLNKLMEFFTKIELSEYQLNICGMILRELIWRLQLLIDIGLEYLTLDRLTHTLSGGEAQRINLSTALGSSLVGTLYVLDEPSIGMHNRDTQRLLNILYKLRNLGNTIIVVEHDLDIIKKADNIIDLGPKAGENGGQLMFAGSYQDIIHEEKSLTGRYLSGKERISFPGKKRTLNKRFIKITKPRMHNLKIEEVCFPLNCITVVTGVSGSGKSTLVHDVLYMALTRFKGEINGARGIFEKISGGENIDHVELVDQSPIGKSSRSTPITYTKAFDAIRELFAQTQFARQLGWRAGHFSFNVPGGRCDVCEGEGTVTVDMQFLPDVHLLCESCKGTRYKKEARGILYRSKSIIDVLNMTVDEAAEFFNGVSKITNKLKILQDVGLGYLKLGQPSTMLSGGESQRIKLANHLDSNLKSHILFIFDEPTTGLHLDDISKLLDCFNKLVNNGHSVIVIEHNLHVIAFADWVIDLGPEAGNDGGRIIATGSPEKIANVKNSYTGIALKNFYSQNE